MSVRLVRPPEFEHRGSTRNIVAPEDVEQRIVVNWLEFHGVPFFACPNGGHRHPAVAARLKAQGVRKGVPDLILPTHRIAIEMKRAKGHPSDVTPEQHAWLRILCDAGWVAFVAYGADQAIERLRARGLGR